MRSSLLQRILIAGGKSWASRLAVITFVAAAPLQAQPAGSDIASAVAAAHAAGKFDGEVLVARGDTILYHGVTGLADREAGRPHRKGERWRWASISKQVTAILIMQEVEKGRLRLDQTVAALLPDFTSPGAASITLEQLLRHTSGLPNPNDEAASDTLAPFYRGERDWRRTCAAPVKRPAGAAFEYNNCDTIVAGAILERLTGRTWAQLVDERIARPAGARTLTARPVREPFPMYEASAREMPQVIAAYGPAGALHGTAADLLAVDRALLSGKLLGTDARRTLWQGDPKLGYVALGAWAFEAKLPACKAPKAFVERQGGIGGLVAMNLLVPGDDLVVVAFSNHDDAPWGQLWQGQGLTTDLVTAALCR